MKRWIAATLAALLVPTAAHAEKRCGWLSNPTPQNWSLNDAAGEWTIMVQGGFEASGMDNIADMQEGEFVPMNYSHGYACFCMNVETDGGDTITQIFSSRQLPLAKCRRDSALVEPKAD